MKFDFRALLATRKENAKKPLDAGSAGRLKCELNWQRCDGAARARKEPVALFVYTRSACEMGFLFHRRSLPPSKSKPVIAGRASERLMVSGAFFTSSKFNLCDI
jgi:hypothetical protein